MENWLFVDFQTLGLDPSSAVLSIGMLYVTEDMKSFNDEELMEKGFYVCLNINSQNRPIDKDTLYFWRMQSKEDLKPFEGYKCGVDEAFNKICIYLRHENFSKEDKVWSKGMIDKNLSYDMDKYVYIDGIKID